MHGSMCVFYRRQATILFTFGVDVDRYSHFEISWFQELQAILTRPLSVTLKKKKKQKKKPQFHSKNS